MVPMDSFYRIFLYPITFILSPFLANHITSCLGFCVDMVSNLDSVSMIFTLFSITTLPHQQNAYVTLQLMYIKTIIISALGVP